MHAIEFHQGMAQISAKNQLNEDNVKVQNFLDRIQSIHGKDWSQNDLWEFFINFLVTLYCIFIDAPLILLYNLFLFTIVLPVSIILRMIEDIIPPPFKY